VAVDHKLEKSRVEWRKSRKTVWKKTRGSEKGVTRWGPRKPTYVIQKAFKGGLAIGKKEREKEQGAMVAGLTMF